MTTPFEGGCMCGAIRYRCAGEPKMFMQCHCRECRYVSGGNAAAVVWIARKDFELTKGAAKSWTCTSEAGNEITRSFCAECGTPLFSAVEVMPDSMGIKAGSMDDDSVLKPSMILWKGSAPPWAHIDETVRAFDKNPR